MTNDKVIRGGERNNSPRNSSNIRAEGELIREIRRTWGMRQRELADMLGCSQAAVSNWETGRRRRHVWRIAMRRQRLREGAASRGLPWRPEWSQALGMVG